MCSRKLMTPLLMMGKVTVLVEMRAELEKMRADEAAVTVAATEGSREPKIPHQMEV
jgi:hypothetical protein